MKTLLSCIEYSVSVVDRQVIFQESMPVHGFCTSFTLERPVEINNTGGIWYLSDANLSESKIPASHITQAMVFCEEKFGKSFEGYKGALKI